MKKATKKQQKKEEQIGSLPEKGFRIMIVNMIKNIENQMDLQINRDKDEKMQEMINKDLEIKKSQSMIKNAITLEGTNSRITETQEWISEVEDTMM